MSKNSKSLPKSIIDMLKAQRGTKALYLLMMIGVVVIILRPPGLPLYVDPYTRTLYDYVVTVPAGSVVLIQTAVEVTYFPEVRPGAIAALRILFNRDAKLVFYSLRAEGSVLNAALFDALKDVMANKKYGVDWVEFGYAPGGESAIAGMATNIRSVFKYDIRGTPIDDIPLMKGVNSYQDIFLILAIASYFGDASARVWGATYHKTYLSIGSALSFAVEQAFYPELIKGMTNGMLGSAQLEKLAGVPGEGIRNSDGLTFTLMLTVAAVVFGNYLHFTKERKQVRR